MAIKVITYTITRLHIYMNKPLPAYMGKRLHVYMRFTPPRHLGPATPDLVIYD